MTGNVSPAEFDAAEAVLMSQREQLAAQAGNIVDKAHRAAGDTRSFSGWGSQRVVSWQLTDEEAVERAGMAEALDRVRYGVKVLSEQIAAMEDIYRAAPWTRWYPCLNSDGHVHSHASACPTLHRGGQETAMGWETSLSGQPVAVVIEALGPRLCSVCFPGAPAEHCRSLSDITRADREAARAAKNAARDAKLAAKNLTAAESARLSEAAGERVTTVAAARALVREPAETTVELEWNRTDAAAARWSSPEQRENFMRNVEARLARETDAAEVATDILATRESGAPGTGQARETSREAFAKKLKSARREWFR